MECLVKVKDANLTNSSVNKKYQTDVLGIEDKVLAMYANGYRFLSYKGLE